MISGTGRSPPLQDLSVSCLVARRRQISRCRRQRQRRGAEERKNLIALFSPETIFFVLRQTGGQTEGGRGKERWTDGRMAHFGRPSVRRPHNVRYVARCDGGFGGDGTSRKRRVSGEGAGGEQCGGQKDGGGGRRRSLGMVRLPPPPSQRRVCVFTKRNLQLLPPCLSRFRRTVSAVPPRYALVAATTVAAKVTEEEEEEDGQTGGRAKKEGATLPLPSPLIHPISHTFLSHLAEYDRGPAPRLPTMCLSAVAHNP